MYLPQIFPKGNWCWRIQKKFGKGLVTIDTEIPTYFVYMSCWENCWNTIKVLSKTPKVLQFQIQMDRLITPGRFLNIKTLINPFKSLPAWPAMMLHNHDYRIFFTDNNFHCQLMTLIDIFILLIKQSFLNVTNLHFPHIRSISRLSETWQKI